MNIERIGILARFDDGTVRQVFLEAAAEEALRARILQYPGLLLGQKIVSDGEVSLVVSEPLEIDLEDHTSDLEQEED